jgi:hypothetical protein
MGVTPGGSGTLISQLVALLHLHTAAHSFLVRCNAAIQSAF